MQQRPGQVLFQFIKLPKVVLFVRYTAGISQAYNIHLDYQEQLKRKDMRIQELEILHQQAKQKSRGDLIHTDTRVKELETKVTILLNEIQKINMYSVQKSEELERWRFKCLTLESNKVNHLNQEEIERYRLQTQEIQNKLKANELKIGELELLIISLNESNIQLQNLVNAKAEENDILRAKILRLEGQVNDQNPLEIEVKTLREKLQLRTQDFLMIKGNDLSYQDLERQIIDFKATIQKLNTTFSAVTAERDMLRESMSSQQQTFDEEITRLTHQLREKTLELDSRILRFDTSLKELRLVGDEKLQIQKMLSLKDDEIEEWKLRFYRIEKVLQELRAQENQNIECFSEIERLRSLVGLKEEELQSWISRYNSQQPVYIPPNIDDKHQIQQLLKLVNDYQIENSSYKDQLLKMDQKRYLVDEVEQLRTKCMLQENQISTLMQDLDYYKFKPVTSESSLTYLQVEQQIKEKTLIYTTEIELWKSRYQKLEMQVEQQVKDKTQYYTQELELWKRKYTQLMQEKETFNQEDESKIQYLQNHSQEVTFQNDKLISKIKTLEAKIKELEQLKSSPMRNGDVEHWRTKYFDLELRIKNSNFEDYEKKILKALTEIEKLQGINKSRLQEIEEWRLRDYQNQLQLKEVQGYKDKVKLLETELISWQQKVSYQPVSSDEVSRLNNIIVDLRRQIDYHNQQLNVKQTTTFTSTLNQQIEEYNQRYKSAIVST